MKYRIHQWGDIANGTLAWGLQVQLTVGERYIHVCGTYGGVQRAMIYKAKSRAEELVKELNAGNRPEMEFGLVPLKNN